MEDYMKSASFVSVDTIDVFTPNFGSYKYQIDEVENFTFSSGQDTTDLVGAKGSLIGRLKRNPSVTISFTAGMVTLGLMADEFGTEVEDGTVQIGWDDVTTVTSNTATLTYTPTNGVEKVYVAGIPYDVASTAVAGESVTYDSTTRTITFATDEIADGTEVTIKYIRNVKAATVDRRADKVSEKIAIRATGQWEDNCNVTRMWQCDIFSVDPSGSFDVEIGENQATQSFEGTAIRTACATGGKILARWKFFNEDAEDVIVSA